MVATVAIGLVNALAQITARRVGQQRNQARLMQGKDVFVGFARLLCRFACGIAYRRRQPVQICTLQLQCEVVVLGKDVVAETDACQRQCLVDLLQTRLVRIRQIGSATDEIVVCFLCQTHLYGRQIYAVALVVHLLYAGKQGGIHLYLVVVRGKQRHHLLLDNLQLLRSVAGTHHREYACDVGEHLPRTVVCRNGVFECRLVGIGDYRRNLLVVQRHRPFECGCIVIGAYAVERRHSVRCRPLFEKRIGQILFTRPAGNAGRNHCCNR